MKLSARTVKTSKYPVLIGEEAMEHLRKEIREFRRMRSRILILTDSNTSRFCLPELLKRLPVLEEADALSVDAGEESKSLLTAERLWKELGALHADRNSLLINLGGGMVTDLGGFVASAYHRGIHTIHLPTSLIGQVDAAIGGKNGVNMNSLKNQVGSFYFPRGVCVWPGFLNTLPVEQVRSGMAEVAKTALIGDEQFWRRLTRRSWKQLWEIPFSGPFWKEVLLRTIRIKMEIVKQDPFERDRRKLLNFGHTIGHAIESLSIRRETPLLHGEAVAAGMLCEGFLSLHHTGLPPARFEEMVRWILPAFGKLPSLEENADAYLDLMRHDKKNRQQEYRFTLLSGIGKGIINQACTPDKVRKALTNYDTL